MRIIFTAIFLVIFTNLTTAQVSITDIVNRDPNNSQTGSFKINNNTECEIYTIIKGLTTGFQSGQTISAYGNYQQFALPVDMYVVDVYSTCYFRLEVEIKGCNGFDLNLNTRGRCLHFQNPEGIASVNPSGGVAPYNIKWFNASNQLLGTGLSIGNLFAGNHTLVVTDATGCMKIEKFKIEQIALRVLQFKVSNRCFTEDKILVEMSPAGRQYEYSWSDNFTKITDHVHERVVDRFTDYTLTITDINTQCSLTKTRAKNNYDLRFSRVKPFQNPSTETSQDGIISFTINGSLGYRKLICSVYRDGSFFREQTFDGTLTYTFNSVPVGYYSFVFRDQFGCFVAETSEILRSCLDPLDKPKIEIHDYSLPPGREGAYAKARVTGVTDISKCKFTWKSVNPRYSYSTNIPEINSDQLKSITHDESHTLCVEMTCPCGNDLSCVEYNPCGSNTIFFTKKQVNPLCFGTLPTGKPINNITTSTIDLEIDVNYFAIGSQGQPQYNRRIKSIAWVDGTPLQSSYSNGILSITREYSNVIPYELEITDGVGCIYSEKIHGRNSFELKFSDPDDYCRFTTSCGGNSPDVHHLEGEFKKIGPGNCDYAFVCGSKTILSPIHGINADIPGEILVDDEGRCFTSERCLFYYEDTKPPGRTASILVEHVLDPNKYTLEKYYVDGFNNGAFVRISTSITCCDFNDASPLSPAQIHSIYGKLTHVNNDLNSFNNSGLEEPCVAKLFCAYEPGFYKRIKGTVREQILCETSSDRCIKCFKCNYQIGGIDFNSALSPLLDGELSLDVCFDTDLTGCKDTPCNPSQIVRRNINTANKLVSVEYYPNPFDDDLIIIIYSDGKTVNQATLQLFSVGGKLLLTETLNMDEVGKRHKYSISTKYLPSGVYIMQINNGDFVENFKVSKM